MLAGISHGGGFAVTDVEFVSPTRLATYAACPRQYDYEYVQNVESPDETRLYLNQGLAYHETIEDVCGQTEPGDAATLVYDRAMDAFEDRWEANLDADEYASRAHEEYQYAENRAAIAAFFDPEDGDGVEHARRSVATEQWLEYVDEDRGIGLHGFADNVLRTDDGLHVIDYKRNVRGVLSGWTADRLADHLEGESHEAKRVKNAFQTATYVEGVKQTPQYEDGMTVQFSFYGLVHDTEVESTADGYRVDASGRARETTQAYAEHRNTVWSLIERAHAGITRRAYDPEPFSFVEDDACPNCAYRATCPEALESEVGR